MIRHHSSVCRCGITDFIVFHTIGEPGTKNSVAQDLKSVNRILKRCTIQMKVTEQYFPVVLFIMLYKVVLTFESVNEILKCDHSNESY